MNCEYFPSLNIPVLWSGKQIPQSICSDFCWFPVLPSSSHDDLTNYLPSQLLGILFLALPGARKRRNMKTNNIQARNTQLVHTGTSACWSQLRIKDCRESNYLAPCLGLFHLRFSSTLPFSQQCPLAALSPGTDPGTIFTVWGIDCLQISRAGATSTPRCHLTNGGGWKSTLCPNGLLSCAETTLHNKFEAWCI